MSFFNNISLEIIYTEYIPDSDPEFMNEADDAVKKFLQLSNTEKESISGVVYDNCKEFLESIGYHEDDDALWKIDNPVEIWKFVYPQEIYVSRKHRRDKEIYINIACECDWEQEHGLQFVFRSGNKLVGVSAQDGHLTESDAYDTPDGNEVLVKF